MGEKIQKKENKDELDCIELSYRSLVVKNSL